MAPIMLPLMAAMIGMMGAMVPGSANDGGNEEQDRDDRPTEHAMIDQQPQVRW